MSKRVDYIDIARGIGILLVVLGHNDLRTISPFLQKLIYSFHMPLFFFVSGMFFNVDQPFLKLIRRRFNSTLKPYITILLLIFFMTISFTRINIGTAGISLIKAIYANGHYLNWIPLWFLPHLFVINIFVFAFYKLTRIIKSSWIKWTFLIAILVTGGLTVQLFWPFDVKIFGRTFSLYGLPFSIDLVMVSSFFFILGREVNNNLPNNFFSNPVTLIVSAVGLLLMAIYLAQTTELNSRIYPSILVNTLEAVLGITFVMALSTLIEKARVPSAFFRYIGQSSLIILIFHLPIVEGWGEKILNIYPNPVFSFWLAYILGIGIPLLINIFFIKPNPIIRNWFGQTNSPT